MIPTIHDTDVKDKRVLVRVDMDVAFAADGSILDDTRLKTFVPTVRLLLQKGASQIILMGHVGRPEGKVVEKFSTKPIAIRLNSLLPKTVQYVTDCVDVELPNTPIVVLENTRFHKEEEENDTEFARKLALHGDVFVMDAFATAHRAHASTVGLTQFIPGCVGLVIEKELKAFQLEHTQRPLVAILGGAKLETKLPLIQRLINKVDHILVGGAMMFTFYKARGWEIGDSLLDEKSLTMAQMLSNNDKIVIPTDVVVAPSPQEGKLAKVVIAQGMPAGQMGLDIGPESTETFKKILGTAKTIVWNGPLGMVEKEPFDKATVAIAEFVSSLTEHGVTTIVGGGDSIKIVNALGLEDKFTHVSTGGGASMKLLEGKQLVALQALER